MRLSASLVCLALAAALLPAPVGAEPPAPLTRSYDALSDAELDARADFIADRLDAGKKWAWRWQWGWTGVYASGVALGTGRAAATSDGKNRADYITTAVKGAIGTTRLLVWRHPGRVGGEELRTMRKATRQDKVARLQRAEQMLQAVAKRAEQRTSWKAHAGNVFLNLAGAGATWAWGDSDDAWESLAVGLIVGEAHILSAPWRGIQDVDDYKVRFGMKSADRFDWKIVPTVGGAALQVTW